ncbi:GIY-YIG nuclease family protein [Paracoccus sp. SY]|uniref:GIY-YIG nuclease family protein n=1 Tax=Paracoccus sp. SY TaxID=1330255 RepID=UPI000CD0B228|nr:GIY-YIG nuclease family protein [Paracoccus sp. SY]
MSKEYKSAPVAVYRHINANGETIYIGCTCNPMPRLFVHKAKSPWINQVVNITLQWFDDREEALREEARLIALERPANNKIRSDRPYRISRSNGPIILAAWLSERGVSEGDLARAMGVPKARIVALLNPKARPRHTTEEYLCAATGGFVPPEVWNCRPALPADWRASPEQAAVALTNSQKTITGWGEQYPQPIVALDRS